MTIPPTAIITSLPARAYFPGSQSMQSNASSLPCGTTGILRTRDTENDRVTRAFKYSYRGVQIFTLRAIDTIERVVASRVTHVLSRDTVVTVRQLI